MQKTGYFIGIDGGGTKTVMRIVDEQGNVVNELTGGSSNICSNEEEEVKKNLEKLFSGIEKDKIIAICLGTAGISKENAVSILTEQLYSITACKNIMVVGDMELPIYAEAFDENAVSLISGTGSICFGKNVSGKKYRCGGWGHIFGDEGSGYWIGCQAINTMMRSFDGRGNTSLLTELLLEKYECTNELEVISKIYSAPFNKSDMASCAFEVSKAAQNGDEEARKILENAAEHLFELVKATAQRLCFSKEKFVLLLSGSVVTKDTFIIQRLEMLMHKSFPLAQLVVTEKDPSWGAVKIAERIGGKVSL